MLTRDEKSILRFLFQNKIYKADGQAFETLFTSIMNYAESDFQQIKPWGNIGDRKNDGYIKSKGIFFQVFAPEDIQQKYPEAIKKLRTDFGGLITQWPSVNEFYFLVNDKYKGVTADAEQTITEIVATYNLKNGGIKTASYLENLLFGLHDDQIQVIAGIIPDPAKLSGLDFSIVNEVIEHIMKLPLAQADVSEIKLPNWEEKIQFNKLSSATALRLNNGSMQLHSLQNYLDTNGDFLADELRDKMNEIYNGEKESHVGDELFWAIVNKSSPNSSFSFQSAVIVIMAKYFETCDIFERPPEGTDASAN
jgi:hypothetical protein